MLSYNIDLWIEDLEEFFYKRKFFCLTPMGTEEYDDEFTKFILKTLPDLLSKIDS